ncbi:mercury resistance system periplasmic binding protein MerP [Ramlibacter sp. RBP-2]|uniref:Periplasmic mercury ion-binding protein n=1 Tax=Ramlibacter lithotrophicus TaxID=2606681 RepID=A0A7X6I8S2_9BURK|nr:mercury resistance system periplasmic binding protein MerP [Ramlibacter lithotrophicus]NKE68665.1 mercury resistance system periplasmic binding protein MerP [Ramlibacter lithotrophicus]
MKSLAILLGALAITAGAHAATDRSVILQVSNMTCATCPIAVRMSLEKVPGVESAKVDFKTKLAVVRFDSAKTTQEALMKATADAGFPSTLKRVQ